jgi:hypothetical protein
MKRVALRCLTAGIAVFILLLGASSALAFSVSSVTVTPRLPNTAGATNEPDPVPVGDPFASGGHPVMDITTTFSATSPTDSAKEVVQHLGQGIVSNPKATPTC